MSLISGEVFNKTFKQPGTEARKSQAENVCSRSAQYKLNQILVMEPSGIHLSTPDRHNKSGLYGVHIRIYR
jgi:hypothetical protein